MLPRFSAGTINARTCRLRRIERTDCQHRQTNEKETRVVGRERRSRVGSASTASVTDSQGAALDPAGQPRCQRRADAQRDRTESDQKASGADADVEAMNNSTSMPAGANTGTTGDDVSEHQGSGSKAAGRSGVFHANAYEHAATRMEESALHSQPLQDRGAQPVHANDAQTKLPLYDIARLQVQIACYTAASRLPALVRRSEPTGRQ